MARDRVLRLVMSKVAIDKLGARGISAREAEQVPQNAHAVANNPRSRGRRTSRFFLIGRTDGGRTLTLVIERTVNPTTWLVVTGWKSTDAERTILERLL
jgi:hypothetical protein